MPTPPSDDEEDDREEKTNEEAIAFDSSLVARSRIGKADRRAYLSLRETELVSWQQSTSDVEIFLKIPRNASEKNGDIEVALTSASLRVRLKGTQWGSRADLTGGRLFRKIKLDESSWTRVRFLLLVADALICTFRVTSLSLSLSPSPTQDADELYFCLRKDKDIVWESIYEDDHAHRKLPHEILKDMVDADEGPKKKPYEELSFESKILVEEMRERMRMLASGEISASELEREKFVLGEM
jgi:hypothetical protein